MKQKRRNPGKLPTFQNIDKTRGVKKEGTTRYKSAKNPILTSFQSSQDKFKFI